MSKTQHITSKNQFDTLLSSSRIVVADFYADWCGPCKQIAPIYERLSAELSRPSKITFTKVNVDNQTEIAQTYGITAMPTFMIFKNQKAIETIRGANPPKLVEAVKKLAAEADSDGGATSGGFGESSGSGWVGGTLPKGYSDITEQVDLRGVDMLNSDPAFETSRTLFETSKPSALDTGKAKAATKSEGAKDWIETDTDEQLMLYMPFQSLLKIHSLHVTSLTPKSEDESEVPMRPKTIKLYTNAAHVLGFDEAEGLTPTQVITLGGRDWDEKTGTARVELRFVKFQNVTSLVMFVVDGHGEGEKVRIDRLRLIGETGEKRDQGKLQKIGDETGE